ncbi:MAG: M28 family peptidase [Candidatus Hodarchaeales archaeon]|jgi:ABC-type antimicrobial peptide transport system permease subunit
MSNFELFDGEKTILLNKSVETSSMNQIDYQDISDQINSTYFDNIKGHINNFTDFTSRFTSYDGYEQAASYIKDFFTSQGLQEIEFFTYPLVIPKDLGSTITIKDDNYTAFNLFPNSVQTCQTPNSGLTGRLVYADKGGYSDYDGSIINGSIVVLEFNSGNNWIKAASLGAKAIIFLEPNQTTRFEAEEKIVDFPLNVPRVYVSNQTALDVKELALQGNNTATLISKMEFTKIEAKNIVGILPGEDDTELIILSAHYDSFSIVPALAPGADESCGISTLLELLRFMKDNSITPQKSIMFLALSGHNQAAAGAREFVAAHYDNINQNYNGQRAIRLFLSLDLSATNDLIGINPYGYLYKFKLQYTTGNNLIGRIKDIGEGLILNYASAILDATDTAFRVRSYIVLADFEHVTPVPFVGDQEPFVASNCIGLSLFTSETHRLRWNTPLDLPEHLNYDQLKAQVVYSFCAITKLVSDESKLDSYLDLDHKDFSIIHSAHVGFGYVEGYVKEYDETVAWLSNVPNALVKVTSFDPQGLSTNYLFNIITMTDETGYYHVKGAASSQPDHQLEFRTEAYVLQEGKIVKATDRGSRGQVFDRKGLLNRRTITLNPTVFECGTIQFYGIIHPHTQEPAGLSINFVAKDPITRSDFFSFGYEGSGTVANVYLPPDTPSIIVGTLSDNTLGIYATNSNLDNPKGIGYQIIKSQTRNLGFSAFIISKDLLSMSSTYIDLYKSYNIEDKLVDETYKRAADLIEHASNQNSEYQYSQAIVNILEAQTWAYDTFSGSRGVITDGTASTVFFAILLIPFSFTLTSLLFDFDSGMKKITVTGLIYGSLLLFFYIIHPGLHLTGNIGMIIIGIVALIFVFPALFMIYSEGYDFLKSLRVKMVGAHFADTSRSSAALIAMTTGIQRMKKRKGRTLIALSGIILITFSLTLFTSASAQLGVYARGEEGPTPYTGVNIRVKDWTSPLSEVLLENIQNNYGSEAEISSRWWLFPPGQTAVGYMNISANNAFWLGFSILGASPEEVVFLDVNSTLISGNWFTSYDSMECVLPNNAADDLDVVVNDTVNWGGSSFKVIGIVDGAKFDLLKDFDNEEITPKNFRVSSPYAHLRSNQVFIIPSLTAKEFGAGLYTISVKTSADNSVEIADSISSTYGRFLEVYRGDQNEGLVYSHKRAIQSLGSGIIELALPLAIAILLMINTSVSTVYESKREINTFTSLGLTPFDIAGLFLAEFLVYAIIGSVIGYLGGITIAVILSALQLFPESLSINYSSGSVVNALVFGIGGILLSTIYPLSISAKMSVPSVSRAWKLKTKPETDEKGMMKWDIPLPFVAATETEAEGTIEFLREFFVIYESESVGGVFFANKITTSIKRERNEKHLQAITSLAPFDMGIKQKVDLFAYFDELGNRYKFQVNLTHVDGILSAWEASVRRFVDSMRKQLLLWRNLPPEEKAKIAEQFRVGIKKPMRSD